jgi:ElaB/YqjD/DUF883 family membrane-anchored ribosome-binding protein
VTTLKSVAEKTGAVGHDVRESLQEFGGTAGRKFNEWKEDAGNVLCSMAASARESSARIEDAASKAAKNFSASAFRKDYSEREVFGIAIAAIVGFIAGSALTRTMRSHA